MPQKINVIGSSWYNPDIEAGNSFFKRYDSKTSLQKVLKEGVEERFKCPLPLDLPTLQELKESLTLIESAPFLLTSQRPSKNAYFLYKTGKKVQGYDCDSGYLKEYASGYSVPLLRLKAKSNRALFLEFLTYSLTPIDMAKDGAYSELLKDPIENLSPLEELQVTSKSVVQRVLYEDNERADIDPYHEKMLEDINQGHWSLWDGAKKGDKRYTKVKLEKKLVARDPKSSIVDGVVGIDFGTKSTVVVYQKDTTKIYPMRIGTGTLSRQAVALDYENPTIMEFNNFEQFMQDYLAREGRPYTHWNDLTISHTALNNMINSKSVDFNSFVSELKQWAGDKKRKLKLVDKKKNVIDIASFVELDDEEINPIELYAYYLGLFINNQHNGIFLNYILSFPVTYEVEIRDKLIESFYKGIRKSLPQELITQKEMVDKLQVLKGASEPAAYAVVALSENGFEPEGDERVFYGVFDFGGGTTDFDFGIYRESNGAKERRYDYVIEHFGAGGDRYLGGENLLEILAFELFKKNQELLLESKIQFLLPPEQSAFAGSESMLSMSREAKVNTKLATEALRAIWENNEERVKEIEESGTIELNLVDIDAKVHTNFSLKIEIQEMQSILSKRIEKGVKNFFTSLNIALNRYYEAEQESAISLVNIFLAGNSSKSRFVTEIFEKEMLENSSSVQQLLSAEDEVFKIYPPLGIQNSDIEKPTGKTGVAFGLIETRKGGSILVIDNNTKENIDFKYYLGENRKKRFNLLIDRTTAYNEWIEFIDAGENTFEVFYSSQAIVVNAKTAIDDASIKKMTLNIDTVNEDALVYVRLVSPTSFEYVVAFEDGLNDESYEGEIQCVEI